MPRVVNRKIIFFLISLIIGTAVWFLPAPEGVSSKGIHMLGNFCLHRSWHRFALISHWDSGYFGSDNHSSDEDP